MREELRLESHRLDDLDGNVVSLGIPGGRRLVGGTRTRGGAVQLLDDAAEILVVACHGSGLVQTSVSVGGGGAGGSVGGCGWTRSTTMVKCARCAAIAPTAASIGAATAPMAATVRGISTKVWPCSSRMMMRRMLPAWISSWTLSTSSLPRTLNSSRVT